jgi:hypothetical protein
LFLRLSRARIAFDEHDVAHAGRKAAAHPAPGQIDDAKAKPRGEQMTRNSPADSVRPSGHEANGIHARQLHWP